MRNAIRLSIALSLGVIVATATAAMSSAGTDVQNSHALRSSATRPTGEDYLSPTFRAADTYSNVFSIMISRKVEGYDERVGRNGGSADYTVISASPSDWRFKLAGRYDGQPVSRGELDMRDGGRCSIREDTKGQCQPYLEASGLTYNPYLWGVPPKSLTEGMTWRVDLPQAWEMGGASGTQKVTVVHVDPRRVAVTLLREGSGQGFFSESDAKTVQLTRAGQTETFDVIPGVSHWRGYTTFVKGVIFNDELTVTRDDELRGADGKSVIAVTRRIMLLNASPFPTL